MEIEDVSGISFAAGRAAKQQRNFTIGCRMFREIVVDTKGVTSVIAKELAHGAGGVGRNVLHGRGFGGGCSDYDGVFHRARIFENFYDLRDRRTLLTDRVINADQVIAFAVDDGIESDGGLAGLAISDDEFALAAADRDHGVDGFE